MLFRSRTFGELATHLCGIPRFGLAILNDASLDLLASPPTDRVALPSRDAILTAFDEAVRKMRVAMDKSDAELNGLWTLKRGDQEMFTLPRIAAVRSFILHHLIHHRGQLSVYLRLNDIPVPAIYGPSADEG